MRIRMFMKAPPVAGVPEPADSSVHGARRRKIVITGAVVVAIIVTVTSLLVTLRDDRSTPLSGTLSSSPTATGQRTTTSQETTTPTATATTIPTVTAGRPNDGRDLAAFLSAAATLDKQLSDAAAAINAAGPPWVNAGPELARVVKAADLTPVARAIPAGLPHDVLQAVILVYSDLSSRRHAMESFAFTPVSDYGGGTEDLLRELRYGHAAAERFDADLAAARTLAAATPPIAAVPGDSRLVAEVLLQVQNVATKNAGCGGRGGIVITELPKISWKPLPSNPNAEGTIGVLHFSADYRRDGGWHVLILVC